MISLQLSHLVIYIRLCDCAGRFYGVYMATQISSFLHHNKEGVMLALQVSGKNSNLSLVSR